MLAKIVVFAVIATTSALSPSWGHEIHARTTASGTLANLPIGSRAEQLDFIFPHNIRCKDFEKLAHQVWRLRNRTVLDLGNWDAAFAISGPISPGLYVRRGVDLFDILEAKCEMSAQTSR